MVDETEQSYGIIPLRSTTSGSKGKKLEVLLIHQTLYASGLQWSIPKGHAEQDDASPRAAAERELKEETGLQVSKMLLSEQTFEEHYTNPERRTQKQVTYWACLVEGTLTLQESEVAEARWLDLEEAIALATFEDTKETLRQVQRALLWATL
ncbi:NUDIX hydrolase domain-like protein [Protomyces lactucae-debilis]|uniref:NUDIX hydrolase domain-like protein n=1 Tax=Protomyces lactucae-debilis TaxID=2754530 RepID=A0A1Y2FIT6_PROLT|nr:NUDIX hydrolase domain-like protein [Protomyces lactucae-debilis]ORY83860.1 NUDIX hydrolase domain-like protein [Protomyces lactucae-debilis]